MTVRGSVVAAALLVLDSSPSGCIKLAVMQVLQGGGRLEGKAMFVMRAFMESAWLA